MCQDDNCRLRYVQARKQQIMFGEEWNGKEWNGKEWKGRCTSIFHFLWVGGSVNQSLIVGIEIGMGVLHAQCYHIIFISWLTDLLLTDFREEGGSKEE